VGWVVIAEAGNDDKVRALVYIDVAAFAPGGRQSVSDIQKGEPAPPWAGELRKDSAAFLTLVNQSSGCRFRTRPSFIASPMVAATQVPWFAGFIDDRATTAAWRNRPSRFVVAIYDRMIDRD
jgi:hypothetical protein